MNKFVICIEDDGQALWTSYQVEPKTLEPDDVAPLSHQLGIALAERLGELIDYMKEQNALESTKLN